MLVLTNISQVLTLQGPAPPRLRDAMDAVGAIPDGALVIRGEEIVWVGAARDLPEPERGATVIDGRGRALVALPGFVDAHTHPVFAGTRVNEYDARARGATYQEIAAAGGGIRASTRQLRGASLQDLATTVEHYFGLFLAHGTTTIEAKTGYGLSAADEMKSLEVLAALRSRSPLEAVPTLLAAHDVPDEHRDSRDEYVRQVREEMIPRAASGGRARFCDVFCEEGYFTVEESRAILTAARVAGLGLRIHAEELGPSGGARLAAELRVSSADHLEWIDPAGIDGLARAGTVATLLPGVTFNLGLRHYAPARSLVAAGVPVALATDFNPGSCFTPNLQAILSIACSQLRLSPAEAVTAATINAAYSLGLSGRIGSLEPGKQADVVLMDVSDYREIPYLFGVNHCAATIKRGSIVVNRLEET
jgi:imidazolonepropionase